MGMDEELDRAADLAQLEIGGQGDRRAVAYAADVDHDLVGLFPENRALEIGDHVAAIVE
jgi:hypothetical protein